MKQILLSLIFLVCTQLLKAQTWEYGFGYTNQTPKGLMAGNINPAHGFNFQVGYRLPILRNKFVLSTDFGSGRYGKKRVSQTFQSDVVQTPQNLW